MREKEIVSKKGNREEETKGKKSEQVQKGEIYLKYYGRQRRK